MVCGYYQPTCGHIIFDNDLSTTYVSTDVYKSDCKSWTEVKMVSIKLIIIFY